MSALPPKADMDPHGRDVRFVPKAEVGLSTRATTASAIGANRGVRVHRNMYNALHQEE